MNEEDWEEKTKCPKKKKKKKEGGGGRGIGKIFLL